MAKINLEKAGVKFIMKSNKRALKKINNKESLALDRFIMLLVICLVFVMGCIIKGL